MNRFLPWIANLFGLALLVMTLVSNAHAAETPAVFVRANARIQLGSYVTGNDAWRFVPTTDLYVTSLGYFDADNDGLLHSHHAGIFEESTGTLVTGLQTIGPNDPFLQRFRWHDIPPVKLTAGTAYFMSVDQKARFDPVVNGTSNNFIVRPEVGYQDYWWNYNGYLSMPTFQTAQPGWLTFGGSFKFQLDAPVANESASWGSIKSLYD